MDTNEKSTAALQGDGARNETADGDSLPPPATNSTFGLTLGAGLHEPQGRWHVLPVWNPVALCEIISRHKGREAWFCLSHFKAGTVTTRVDDQDVVFSVPDNYRHGDVWDYAVGAGVDVDTPDHAPLPSDTRKLLQAAARGGVLPGQLYYDTPAGARLVQLFDELIYDRNEFLRRTAELKSDVLAALGNLGLDIKLDTKCTSDRARLYFTPNCLAKGKQRHSEVLILPPQGERPKVEAAPTACRNTQPKVEASAGIDLASMGDGSGRNNLLSGRCWKWRKLGLDLEEVAALARETNKQFGVPLPDGEVEKIVNGKRGIEAAPREDAVQARKAIAEFRAAGNHRAADDLEKSLPPTGVEISLVRHFVPGAHGAVFTATISTPQGSASLARLTGAELFRQAVVRGAAAEEGLFVPSMKPPAWESLIQAAITKAESRPDGGGVVAALIEATRDFLEGRELVPDWKDWPVSADRCVFKTKHGIAVSAPILESVLGTVREARKADIAEALRSIGAKKARGGKDGKGRRVWIVPAAFVEGEHGAS